MNYEARVLLVEDNILAQMAAKMIIASTGCRVDVSSSGQDAIQLASQNTYDIIFMDIGLGDMNGFEVADNIHKKAVINLRTPIVALTAHSEESYKELAERSGMVGFITKPLSLEAIQGILDKYLDNP